MKRPNKAWLLDLLLIALLLLGIILRVGTRASLDLDPPWPSPAPLGRPPTMTVTPGWWSENEYAEPNEPTPLPPDDR
jgi:hypothetical protein